MNTRIGWGVLGCGAIAGDFARDLPHSRTGRLVAVGSRSADKAAAFARDPGGGCRAHGSYEALLADPEVAAVYVATPHPFHAAHSIAALRAGKHVLCEKPFALSVAEAEGVFTEARRAGRFVMEAFKDRCHPLTDAVVAALPRLGRVRLIDATFGGAMPIRPESRLFNRALGGGGILDIGCYPVAFARRIAGALGGATFADPVDVAAMATLAPETGTDVCAAATLRFADGLLARLACGLAVRLENTASIHGDAGTLKIPLPWARHRAGEQTADLALLDGTRETLRATAPRPIFALEADVAGEAIRAGRREANAMSWDDTRGNLRVIEQWLASAR